MPAISPQVKIVLKKILCHPLAQVVIIFSSQSYKIIAHTGKKQVTA